MKVLFQNKSFPKSPAREILWEHISTGKGKQYMVTSNAGRDKYYLYAVKDGKLSERIGVASTPPLLKNKYLKE